MTTESVKAQLRSLEFAIPDHYDKETNTYHIPKYNGPIYKKGSCYIISFYTELTNELLLSWNNSNIPRSTYLKVVVNTTMGKMIKVDAMELDRNTGMSLGTMWFGWLNIDYIQQLATLS